MSGSPESASRDAALTRLIRHYLPVLGMFAVIGGLTRTAAVRLTNDDTFFHLRFGEAFRDGDWSIWSTGPVTTFGTRDWIPTQWASQIAMSAAEDVGGTAAVAWLAGTMYITFAVTLYLACRRWAAPLPSAALAAAAVIVAAPGLSARPQVISYLFAVITVTAWLRTREDGRARWWLVGLVWAWSSLHGMWIVGISINLVAATALWLDQPSRRSARLLLIPLLSGLSVALAPVGPRLLLETVTIGSRGKYFAEWGPTDFSELYALLLAAVLALTLLLLTRTPPGSWLPTLLALLALAWALYAERAIPVAGAILIPVTAQAIGARVPGRDRRGDRAAVLTGAAVASVALAVIAPHTLKVAPDHPRWMNDLLADQPAGTVVLNEWAWGGYLMWKHPDLDFVISGYGDVYTTDELDRNARLTLSSPRWLEDLEAVDPAVAVLDVDGRLAYQLRHTAKWQVLREDETHIIMVPPSND